MKKSEIIINDISNVITQMDDTLNKLTSGNVSHNKASLKMGCKYIITQIDELKQAINEFK